MLSLARGVSHRSDGGIAVNVTSHRYVSSELEQRRFLPRQRLHNFTHRLFFLVRRGYRQQRLFIRMFRWFRPRREALGRVLR
jgi:hypothetical protein